MAFHIFHPVHMDAGVSTVFHFFHLVHMCVCGVFHCGVEILWNDTYMVEKVERVEKVKKRKQRALTLKICFPSLAV